MVIGDNKENLLKKLSDYTIEMQVLGSLMS
jgi:hypothetical protein